MYDPLYDAILPSFEARTGVARRGRGPTAASRAQCLRQACVRDGDALDLISTHTKYAPSQAAWLLPLDDFIADELASGSPAPARGAVAHRRPAPSGPPQSGRPAAALPARSACDGAADVDRVVRDHERDRTRGRRTARRRCTGFSFPVATPACSACSTSCSTAAGGDLFDDALQPAFDSPAGSWAIEQIVDLHQRHEATPRDLPDWHYDEISASFRAGHAAMVSDWPGSYHLYRSPATCRRAGPESSLRCSRQDRRARAPRMPAATRSRFHGARRTPRCRRRCSRTSRRSMPNSARRVAARSLVVRARSPQSGPKPPHTLRKRGDGSCSPRPSRR